MKLGRESDIQERMGDVTCLLSGQGDRVTASQTHGSRLSWLACDAAVCLLMRTVMDVLKLGSLAILC